MAFCLLGGHAFYCEQHSIENFSLPVLLQAIISKMCNFINFRLYKAAIRHIQLLLAWRCAPNESSFHFLNQKFETN